MAELTAVYFVVRPHGYVCIHWGNKAFGGEKEKVQKVLQIIYLPPLMAKGTSEKDKTHVSYRQVP